MKRRILGISLALMCSGCAQIEQHKAEERQQAHANYVAALKNRCATYGYQPGTTEFANCMMMADQASEAAQQADFQQRRAIAAEILLRQ